MTNVNVAPPGRITRFGTVALAASIVAMLVASAIPALAGPVSVTNLITDDQSANPALLTDHNLINAWGVRFPPPGPLGVPAADSSRSMLYSIDPVTNVPTKIGLEVSIAGNPT